ncbi:hypothetical protein [uncultured Thiodictyon sp.]|uniref:hypothetical protein n=1 Tax=uncultured Thiodictyon sp. TaxID=1846217 RepID=UPI0025F6E3FD|nr:hypothetical protein [uncultured Thiodictyon sp.]
MSLSIHLPTMLEERLAHYCRAHDITEDEAIQIALQQFLSETPGLTPYALGVEGFGADQTHCGDIARNSRQLLRDRFRDPATRSCGGSGYETS